MALFFIQMGDWFNVAVYSHCLWYFWIEHAELSVETDNQQQQLVRTFCPRYKRLHGSQWLINYWHRALYHLLENEQNKSIEWFKTKSNILATNLHWMAPNKQNFVLQHSAAQRLVYTKLHQLTGKYSRMDLCGERNQKFH